MCKLIENMFLHHPQCGPRLSLKRFSPFVLQSSLLFTCRMLQMKTLNEALVHSSPEVRISAFSVLCHQKKKGDAPIDSEMTIIRQFIDENLSVDSPSFRQEFLSDFTSLTLRCRNFCVANLRKNAVAVDCVVKQLDTLTKSLMENLFPGANYQRLITALDFLRVLALCLYDYEPGKWQFTFIK